MKKSTIKKEITNIILFIFNIAIIIYAIYFLGINSCEVSKCYVDEAKAHAELASVYAAKADMLEKNITLCANEISVYIEHINNSISSKHKNHLIKLIKNISRKSGTVFNEDMIVGAMIVALIESNIYQYTNDKSTDELRVYLINKLNKK